MELVAFQTSQTENCLQIIFCKFSVYFNSVFNLVFKKNNALQLLNVPEQSNSSSSSGQSLRPLQRDVLCIHFVPDIHLYSSPLHTKTNRVYVFLKSIFFDVRDCSYFCGYVLVFLIILLAYCTFL